MADDQSTLPSPVRVIDAFQAFHRTAAVKAGVELDLFTAIGEGVDTAQALAARCQKCRKWRRREGVEPSVPREEGQAGFEV